MFISLNIERPDQITEPNIYQSGYTDNGLDTAPVRREAESGREVTHPNQNRPVTVDIEARQDLQHALAISTTTHGSSQSVQRKRDLHNTKVAANMLVHVQEKMLCQDSQFDEKRMEFYNQLLRSLNKYFTESTRLEYLRLRV